MWRATWRTFAQGFDLACVSSTEVSPTFSKSENTTSHWLRTMGGVGFSSCTTACDKLAMCSFIKVGDKDACAGACEKQAYQYQIDCINNTACDKMQMACGGNVNTGGSSGPGGSSGTGGSSGSNPADVVSISQCEATCDQLLFSMCFEAADQSACRTACSAATTTTAKRDTFSSCVNASTGQCPQANACYSTFQN